MPEAGSKVWKGASVTGIGTRTVRVGRVTGVVVTVAFGNPVGEVGGGKLVTPMIVWSEAGLMVKGAPVGTKKVETPVKPGPIGIPDTISAGKMPEAGSKVWKGASVNGIGTSTVSVGAGSGVVVVPGGGVRAVTPTIVWSRAGVRVNGWPDGSGMRYVETPVKSGPTGRAVMTSAG
jgi:hypothetical protein